MRPPLFGRLTVKGGDRCEQAADPWPLIPLLRILSSDGKEVLRSRRRYDPVRAWVGSGDEAI